MFGGAKTNFPRLRKSILCNLRIDFARMRWRNGANWPRRRTARNFRRAHIDTYLARSCRCVDVWWWRMHIVPRIEREREREIGYVEMHGWMKITRSAGHGPFVAYHFGSITGEPWKNLPVRFGTINFHLACARMRADIGSSPH